MADDISKPTAVPSPRNSDDESTRAPLTLSSGRRFATVMARHTGWRLPLAFALQLLLASVSGLTVLMLVPFLSVLGVSGGPSSSALVDFVRGQLARLGAELTLGTGLAAFVALVAAQAMLRYVYAELRTQISEGLARSLRDRFFAALVRAEWLCVVRMRGSDIGHMVHSDIGRMAALARAMMTLLDDAVMITIQIAIALYLSPLLALTAIAAAIALQLLLRPLNRRVDAAGRSVRVTEQRIFAMLNDSLESLKLVKALGIEERQVTAFRGAGETKLIELMAFTRVQALMRNAYSIGAALIVVGFVHVAVGFAGVQPTELIMLAVVFTQLLPQFSNLHANLNEIRFTLPAVDAYETLIAQLDESREDDSVSRQPAPTLADAITLAGVSFRFPGSQQPALSEIDLVVPARRTTAIVGESGAGKTSLADMLIGLLEPSAGRISIDGRPLDSVSLKAWRRSVGYVPQETTLFHASVRENLCWARPDAGDGEIRAALRMAAAESFVESLPQGLDTVLGDRGMRLSGGERQRLALARALLLRPQLLVLDEATSALDAENERRIQEAVERLRGEVTVVVIAHRLSTIRNADQIIVLERGRIIEAGRWEDLARAPGGSFATMLAASDTRADR